MPKKNWTTWIKVVCNRNCSPMSRCLCKRLLNGSVGGVEQLIKFEKICKLSGSCTYKEWKARGIRERKCYTANKWHRERDLILIWFIVQEMCIHHINNFIVLNGTYSTDINKLDLYKNKRINKQNLFYAQ